MESLKVLICESEAHSRQASSAPVSEQNIARHYHIVKYTVMEHMPPTPKWVIANPMTILRPLPAYRLLAGWEERKSSVREALVGSGKRLAADSIVLQQRSNCVANKQMEDILGTSRQELS